MNIRKKMTIVVAGVAALGGGIWAYRDYRSWLALGPGGLPYNLYGWVKVTRLRLMKRNPTETVILERFIGREGDLRGLATLPRRAGSRPRVDPHPIPHRQTDQHGSAQVRQEQHQIFDQQVANHPHLLIYRKSHFERRNDAICLREPEQAPRHAQDAHGEIAHIHPSDGSMHMILSPSDAKTVIEAGWGERHPLAGVYVGLPETYMLIYAPRSAEENAVLERILGAAVVYAAGTPPR